MPPQMVLASNFATCRTLCLCKSSKCKGMFNSSLGLVTSNVKLKNHYSGGFLERWLSYTMAFLEVFKDCVFYP